MAVTAPASASPSQTPSDEGLTYYPIGSVPAAGALRVLGDPSSKVLVLLSAGYPDDDSAFAPLASRLADEAGCLTGVTCLPGYDDRADFPYTKHRPDGYSFDEMASAMREAAKALRAASTNDGAKLIGIFHDWGVAPGMAYANRCLEGGDAEKDLCPDRIVLFDVLGPPHPETADMPDAKKPTIYDTVITLTYRVILATSFGIRRYVSKYLAQAFFLGSFIPMSLLKLGPLKDIDAKTSAARDPPLKVDRMIYMAYPYLNMFKAMLTNKWGALKQMHLPKDLIRTPVLYMYGTEKRVMFHDERSITVLQREGRSASKVVPVEGAGHWLYLHEPDLCMEEVKKFVSDA